MPIEAGIIDKSQFQEFRTRQSKESKFEEFLKFALEMEDGTAAKLSHSFSFTDEDGTEIEHVAKHTEKNTCPLSSYIMNQRGRLGLRKGMFRSTHHADGDLMLYRTKPDEVKSYAASLSDEEADEARADGTA